MTTRCTTHHACDCITARLAELTAENERLRADLEESEGTQAIGAIGYRRVTAERDAALARIAAVEVEVASWPQDTVDRRRDRVRAALATPGTIGVGAAKLPAKLDEEPST